MVVPAFCPNCRHGLYAPAEGTFTCPVCSTPLVGVLDEESEDSVEDGDGA